MRRKLPAFAALLTSFATAQAPTIPVLSVVSASDGSVSAPGPFIRTEPLVTTLTGLPPFGAFSLFVEPCLGACPPPTGPTPPGVVGTFGIFLPNAFVLDGLGIFGAPLAWARADATGSFSFVALVPASLEALPVNPLTFRMQAVTLAGPQPGSPTPPPFTIVLSNLATFTIDEPPALSSPTTVTPSFFAEGVPTEITLGGAASILLRATVVPVVRFTASNGGATGVATNVRVVFEGGVPVIKATTPAFLGAPTNPPFTSAGRVDVGVDYAALGLYPANPASGLATTSATTEADATYFVMQALTPAPSITGVGPGAGPIGGLPGVVVDGASFLRGSVVTFDPGGLGETTLATACDPAPGGPCTNVTGARLLVDAPAHAPARVGVRVRGPDHLTISPRESAPGLAATFAYFDPGQLAITVTGVTPSAVDESLGTVAVAVTGTCAEQGGYAVLSPASGPTTVRLGYLVGGSSGSIDVTPSVTSVTTPDPATPGVPGSFRIDLDLPGLPPGLNPPGLSGAIGPGLTNTGTKLFQIVPPSPFGSTPHQPLAAIPSAEPFNALLYRGPAPTVVRIDPNNVGRADGGQRVTVVGTNFFTQETSLAAAQAGTSTELVFGGFGPAPATATFVGFAAPDALLVDTPDLAALLAALPTTVDVVARNPDGRTSVAAPDFTLPDADVANDFVCVPSLAEPLAGVAFTPAGPSLTLDTGTLAAPNLFFFGGSLTLPAGFTLKAEGEAPLVVRVRGDLVIDGDVDLRGASIVGGTYGRPAGAGRGGAGADPSALALENALRGRDGAAPASPFATGLVFGGGGGHDVFGGGGGGGGMSAAGLDGGGGIFVFGPGGVAYGVPGASVPTTLLDVLATFGGAGGGAGGVGVDAASGDGIFFAAGEPTYAPALYEVALNGGGGSGGGAAIFACDGALTVNGRILLAGAPGQAGGVSQGIYGGGGGGGAGGAVVLQALQRLNVAPTAVVDATGGLGGAGGSPGVHDGGAGAVGALRFAIPAPSRFPAFVLTTAGATLAPAPDTTGF